MAENTEKAGVEVMRHYVTFYSPGTFTAEQSAMAIDSWNVDAAMEMARGVRERYGATPYGFRFSTRGRGADDLDSKEIATSGMYYLGGTIETLADVQARDPGSILASNMRINGFNRVITNNNSYRWTQPLGDDDVVLDWTPTSPPVSSTTPATSPIAEPDSGVSRDTKGE